MIFITVGTANKGFDRLLKECDRIAKKTGLAFFAQTGSSPYIPATIPSKQWLTESEMNYYYIEASALIIHGGFGTLSETLRMRKPIIVVPRRFEDGEAVNNQTDLATKLATLGFIKCVNVTDLEQIINNLHSLSLNPYNLTTTVPDVVSTYINELMSNGKN